jgi:hypothetical protein
MLVAFPAAAAATESHAVSMTFIAPHTRAAIADIPKYRTMSARSPPRSSSGRPWARKSIVRATPAAAMDASRARTITDGRLLRVPPQS